MQLPHAQLYSFSTIVKLRWEVERKNEFQIQATVFLLDTLTRLPDETFGHFSKRWKCARQSGFGGNK